MLRRHERVGERSFRGLVGGCKQAWIYAIRSGCRTRFRLDQVKPLELEIGRQIAEAEPPVVTDHNCVFVKPAVCLVPCLTCRHRAALEMRVVNVKIEVVIFVGRKVQAAADIAGVAV